MCTIVQKNPNMKKSIVTIIALILAIGASAGTVTKSFDNLKKFNGIQICDTFKATLVQGDEYKAVVTIDTEFEEYLDVSVVGNLLYVRLRETDFKTSLRKLNRKTFNVTITAPSINQIHLTGTSSLVSTDLWTSPMEYFILELNGTAKAEKLRIEGAELKADLSGASSATVTGDFEEVEVKATGTSALFLVGNYEDVNVNTTGTAKVSFIGSADDIECKCAGSSYLDAMELKVKEADIKCSGASKATIDVEEKLDVTLKGASTCQYRSNSESLSVTPNISRASSFKRIH